MKGRGVRVALDASGEVLRHAALAGPSILKVNVDELYSAFPSSLPRASGLVQHAAQVLTMLRPNGLELLLITDGAQGAYLFAPDREPLHVVTPIESWACSAGAGDSFMAGFLLALNGQHTLEDALAQASAAAAASIHHIVSGYIDRSLFTRLKGRTQVRQIALGGLQ
jgi:fructose-1-phosphate kinase PfkB-like protein